jgi:multicomponent Na+:H+ antiporter subunit D
VSHLAPLPVAVPMLVAALILATAPFLPRWLADALAIATAAIVTGLCLALVRASSRGMVIHWFGGWRPRSGVAVGIAFAVDPIGAGAATVSALLVTLALVVIWRRFDVHATLFHALMLVILAAMCGFCLTGDVFNLFVFFELMSVSAFALTALRTEERGALQGALGFAVVNSIGAFFVLSGIALLYGRTSALNLAEIGRRLGSSGSDRLVVCAFTLIVVGFLVKAAIVPFHFWLADAATVAPTPLCMVLAGALDALGLYAVARIYWTAFAGITAANAAPVRGALIGLGVLSALVGAVMCLCQRHLKRLLAFALISHSGLLLIAIGLLSRRGITAFAAYAVADGLVKAALFATAGAVGRRRGSFDLSSPGGPSMPATAALLAVGGLALAGLPPFGTAVAKALLEHAAAAGGDAWVTAVVVLASALTGGAVLRAVPKVWQPRRVAADRVADRTAVDEPGADELVQRVSATPRALYAVSVVLLGLAVVAGLTPGLLGAADRAAGRFVDQPAYAAAVLDGRALTAASTGNPTVPSGAPLGVVAAVGAVTIAVLAERSAQRRRSLPEWVGAPVRVLRGLHSGRLGDAVMWLTLGTTIFGGVLVAGTR